MLKKLPILFRMAEYYNIADKLTTNFLLKSPSQNYAIIQILKEKHEPLIENGKLNPKFGMQPGMLLDKYEIDLKKAIKDYQFDESILNKKNGFEDCIEDDKIKKSDISKVEGFINENENQEKCIGDE